MLLSGNAMWYSGIETEEDCHQMRAVAPADVIAGMKKTLYSQPEAALARKSKKLAESKLRFTNPDRLAATITDYIEWRAFALWVRLIVETEGGVSQDMKALLDERCPGFLDAVEAYRRAHPREREFLWMRLISWLDRETFGFAQAEGWLHALSYYATRDPRMDQITDYWLRCDEQWKRNPPPALPTFEQWRQTASQTRV
jgi:hypothetical protein